MNCNQFYKLIQLSKKLPSYYVGDKPIFSQIASRREGIRHKRVFSRAPRMWRVWNRGLFPWNFSIPIPQNYPNVTLNRIVSILGSPIQTIRQRDGETNFHSAPTRRRSVKRKTKVITSQHFLQSYILLHKTYVNRNLDNFLNYFITFRFRLNHIMKVKT